MSSEMRIKHSLNEFENLEVVAMELYGLPKMAIRFPLMKTSFEMLTIALWLDQWLNNNTISLQQFKEENSELSLYDPYLKSKNLEIDFYNKLDTGIVLETWGGGSHNVSVIDRCGEFYGLFLLVDRDAKTIALLERLSGKKFIF